MVQTEILTAVEEKMAAVRTEFQKLVDDMKQLVGKEVEEKRLAGEEHKQTREQIVTLEQKIRALEQSITTARADAASEIVHSKSFGEQLVSNPEFIEWGKRGFNRPAQGNFRFEMKGGLETKALMTTGSLGAGTSGVFMPQRQGDVISIPRIALRVRDLLPVRPLTVGNSVDYLKENTFLNLASPQTEGSVKSESILTYTTMTATIRTIAHFINVTRQALDDFAGLRADIDGLLMYGLKLNEEKQFLTGDGLNNNLTGIIPLATAYASGTYNVAGDTKLDKLRHMILQTRLALYPVDGIVLNPRDLHDIELIKDAGGGANTGKYILGDPSSGSAVTTVWGVPVVESDSITYGTALVGSFSTGAQVFDRSQAMIEISFEAGTNFTSNNATILCEERLAIAVKRAASFVTGSL